MAVLGDAAAEFSTESEFPFEFIASRFVNNSAVRGGALAVQHAHANPRTPPHPRVRLAGCVLLGNAAPVQRHR